MDTETARSLSEVLTSILKKNADGQTYQWLVDKSALASDKKNDYQLNLTFTSIPRHTGKEEIVLESSDVKKITSLLPGFTVEGWTLDRLSRVWLLMQLDTSDKEAYINRIENLFPQAEMNELVALYSALPLLAYPGAWKLRCAEGIRSNIGIVLDAIMYHNPYASHYLDEGAWNQLVLKAFFTDKNVNLIEGLDQRSNQHLAETLFDYVEERWAAGRTVNPQIWRLTGKYTDESHFYMLERLMNQPNRTNQQAGALALSDCSFEKASEMLDQHSELKTAIEQRKLNWQML